MLPQTEAALKKIEEQRMILWVLLWYLLYMLKARQPTLQFK
jgi:hypothetical protein